MSTARPIAFDTWRRVVLGAGAGAMFAGVLAGLLTLTGALEFSSSGLSASSVLEQALPRAFLYLVPWLVLWLFVIPPLQRIPFGQPWLALLVYVAMAVWAVPRLLDVTGLDGMALTALGLFSLLLGLPVVRAGDVWLSASFFVATHVVAASCVGMQFFGVSLGMTSARLSGDALLTGGKLGPIFGLFGILGQLWLIGSMLRHQRRLFETAVRWWRPRSVAIEDFAFGLIAAGLAVAVMFGVMITLKQIQISGFTPSLGAVSALLTDGVPDVLAHAWQTYYVCVTLALLAFAFVFKETRVVGFSTAGLVAALVVTLVFTGLHMREPGTTGYTAAGLALATFAGAFAYVGTGRLWLPVSLGIGWLLFEGPIFGFTLAGFPMRRSWLHQDVIEYSVWSGGVHGPDASLAGIIAKALLVVAVMLYVKKRAAVLPRA